MTTDTRLTFPTRIDIPAESREVLVELLNARLADAFDLYSQLKQAHWNVKGSDFIQLHALYDTVAADVIDFVDLIAERATALGGLALGTARLAALSLLTRRVPPRCSRRPRHDRRGRGPPGSVRKQRPRRHRCVR